MGAKPLIEIAGQDVTPANIIATIGTALAAVGAVQQGQAEADRNRLEAEEAARREEIARQQAERERVVAAQNKRDFLKQQSALRARRLARLGASGVSGAGTPLLVIN